MTELKHWAIFGAEISLQSAFFVELLKGNVPVILKELGGKKGALFSNFTLNKFIKEEAIHDDYSLSEAEHRSIQTFSSGEQRKALLNYLLASRPDFLVLDNVFDMLDVESRDNLTHRLTQLSLEIPIIQIVKRKSNLLPFITNAIRIHNDEVSFSASVNDYFRRFEKENQIELTETLPPPLEEIVPAGNPVIVFKNVGVSYGDRQIVKNINWKINSGDFWQLMGPNGSGKTTL